VTLNLEAIKARCEKATAKHTCTETPYGCLRCESEIDSLDAECLLLVAEVERLRKVEAAALAYKQAEAAIFDARVRDPRADLYLLFSDMAVARANAFAALDAAQGGG